MVSQIASDALLSLTARPLHAFGMVAGIMLGVTSGIASVAIADTQTAQVDARFDLQRSTHSLVRAEGVAAAGFPSDQVQLIRELAPVKAVGEVSIWEPTADISRFDTADVLSATVVVADSAGVRATGSRLLGEGSTRLLSLNYSEPVVWVGETLARNLGVAPVGTGRGGLDASAQVVVQGVPFSVAGIIRAGPAFGYITNSVVMGRPAALLSLPDSGENIRLVASVRPGSAEAVARYMVGSLDAVEGGLVVRNITPPDGKVLVGRVNSDLRRVGTALATIVGLVGMMSVANTLSLSVLQRTRELGLRSAMGWSRLRIGGLILTESVVAGFFSSSIGAALGLALAAIWSWAHHWDLVVSRPLVLLGLVLGVLASVLGGLIPAIRASLVSPLTAMRA